MASLPAKALPQKAHLNGLSPVCVTMCLLKLLDCGNVRPGGNNLYCFSHLVLDNSMKAYATVRNETVRYVCTKTVRPA